MVEMPPFEPTGRGSEEEDLLEKYWGSAGSRFVLLVVIALLTRLPPVLASDFPLNDGGPFFVVISTILKNGFALPGTIPYNGMAIPFTYPPLAFYLGALARTCTGLPAEEVLRWLPLILSVMIVPAVAFLTKRLTGDSFIGFVTGLVFAGIPRSYVWLIMGAGLTRSLGVLAVMLTLAALAPSLTGGHLTRRELLLGAFGSGIVLLSHPEAPVFLLISAFVLWLGDDRRLVSLGNLALAATGGALLALPWLAIVVHRHGPAPFLAAMHTSSWSPDPSLLDPRLLGTVTGENGVGPLAFMALMGMVLSFLRGHWGLGIWLPALVFLEQRSGKTMGAAVCALLASIVLVRIVWPGIRRLLKRRRAAAFFFVVVAGLIALSVDNNLRVWTSRYSPLVGLQPDERLFFRRVSTVTPADAVFAVLDGIPLWASDRYAEWFPVLAQRRNVTTVQMTEWLPGGVFSKALAARQAGIDAFRNGPNSFLGWVRKTDPRITHILVVGSIREDPVVVGYLNDLVAHGSARLLLSSESGFVLMIRTEDERISGPPMHSDSR